MPARTTGLVPDRARASFQSGPEMVLFRGPDEVRQPCRKDTFKFKVHRQVQLNMRGYCSAIIHLETAPMPKKKPATTMTPKSTPVVIPDWAKRVKAIREEAGITQTDLQKAFKAKFNIMSPIETGRRKFTTIERKQFFELIGKPEDTSIPTTDRSLMPAATKKVAKPVKAAATKTEKATKVTNTAEAAASPAKAPKVGKATEAPKESQERPAAPPALGITDEPPAPAALKSTKASAAPSTQPNPGRRPGSKSPVSPNATAAPIVDLKNAKYTAPEEIRRRSTRKPGDAALLQHVPVRQASMPAGPTPIVEISPVKEAVLHDISRILSNPGLSDSQARRLHALFTSLAVNALLGE